MRTHNFVYDLGDDFLNKLGAMPGQTPQPNTQQQPSPNAQPAANQEPGPNIIDGDQRTIITPATIDTPAAAAPAPETTPAPLQTPAATAAEEGAAATEQAKPAPETTPAPSQTPAATAAPAEPAPVGPQVSDEALLKFAREKSGNPKLTLEELFSKALTPEQQRERDEHFQNEAFKFGLDEKKFTREDHENYILEKKMSKEDLAYKVFKADMLNHDNTLQEERIREYFDEEFGLKLDENDPMRKRKAGLIENLADGYMNIKYSHILNATQLYQEDLDGRQRATNYTNTINKVLDNIGVYTATTKDEIGDFTANVPIPKDILQGVKEMFLDQDMFKRLSGQDPELVAEIIKNTAIAKALPMLLTESMKAYHSDRFLLQNAARQAIPNMSTDGPSMNNEPAPVKDASDTFMGNVGFKNPALQG